jgi:hypothetical protein
LTWLQPIIANRPDRDPSQAIDRMADRFAHVPDLPVAALVNRDPQRRVLIVPSAWQQFDLRRFGAPPLDHDAARQALHVVRVGDAQHARFIDAIDAMARMGEVCRQIAVVGENQQAFGVEVEPADRIDVFADADQLDDRGPLLRIRASRDVAPRFVQQHVPVPLGQPDAPAVDADIVVRGVGLGAQLANGLPVDGHTPLEHELLGGAARRDSGSRQDLLQSFHTPLS